MRKLVELNTGETVWLFSIGELARRVNRTPRTIQKWERAGVVPEPIVSRLHGRRWYLEAEINMYAELAEQERIRRGRRLSDTLFSERVHLEIGRLKENILGELGRASPQKRKYQGPNGRSSSKLSGNQTSPRGKDFYHLGLTM